MRTEEMHVRTDAEKLQRIIDREEIEQIIGKREYRRTGGMPEQELNELWVMQPENRKTASFGSTWGFYTGFDHVTNYYAKQPIPAYYGAQLIAPSIQVAGDGKTAKGLWYSIALFIEEGVSKWLSQKIGIDFIREPEGWKIWHVTEVYDSCFPAGTDHGDTKDIYEPGEDPLEIRFGEPDIQVLTHERILCWADDYPWMPEPYETFADELSYGPEGWPHVKREVFPE